MTASGLDGHRRPRVIVYGAGGHAKVVIEMLALDGRYEIAGLLDPDARLHGTRIMGVPVLGDDSTLGRMGGISHFLLGVGSIGDASVRIRLFECALAVGLEPATVAHPRAVVSAAASLGGGTMLMAAAVVNPGCRVGRNVIINTGAVIDHDCEIDDHVHVATGALSGAVRVGRAAHIGAGATIRQGIAIGAGTVVGAGAVVVADVPENAVVAGVPARPLHH